MNLRNGYSAKVALSLKIDDKELALSRVGPGEVSLRELGQVLEPSHAHLIIQVDNSVDVMDVYLPNGISGDSYEVAYTPASAPVLLT